MSLHHDIPLSGSFNCWAQAYDLPDLLLKISSLKQTGELRFMSSEAEKTVVLHDGAIVFAKSSSADDRLGPHLLKAKKIRFEHLTELSRCVTPERRFGAVPRRQWGPHTARLGSRCRRASPLHHPQPLPVDRSRLYL